MKAAKPPSRAFESYAAWEKWVAANHQTSTLLWIQFAKKTSGIKSVTYQEAVEVALRFGWIDGQAAGLDEDTWLQRYTPRTAKSKWSKINVAKAQKLIAEGKMEAAGMREVERAKADGRWAAAYDSPASITVPPDLTEALAANPAAKKFFQTLDATNRYAVLYRIAAEAKKPETRGLRIKRLVKMLSEGKTIYPSRRKRAE